MNEFRVVVLTGTDFTDQNQLDKILFRCVPFDPTKTKMVGVLPVLGSSRSNPLVHSWFSTAYDYGINANFHTLPGMLSYAASGTYGGVLIAIWSELMFEPWQEKAVRDALELGLEVHVYRYYTEDQEHPDEESS